MKTDLSSTEPGVTAHRSSGGSAPIFVLDFTVFTFYITIWKRIPCHGNQGVQGDSSR